LISVQDDGLKTFFEINDSTGIATLVFYKKDASVVPVSLKDFNYTPGMYAKVFGQFRVYKDERNVVGTKMNAVVKFDEVTNHFL
jgi:hypothetical protein